MPGFRNAFSDDEPGSLMRTNAANTQNFPRTEGGWQMAEPTHHRTRPSKPAYGIGIIGHLALATFCVRGRTGPPPRLVNQIIVRNPFSPKSIYTNYCGTVQSLDDLICQRWIIFFTCCVCVSMKRNSFFWFQYSFCTAF